MMYPRSPESIYGYFSVEGRGKSVTLLTISYSGRAHYFHRGIQEGYVLV
jgi:hypothetical protein